MTTDPAQQQLITVLSGESTAIHLASDDGGVSRRSAPPLTLCRRPVESPISTQSFHRLGCPACAVEAVRSGITSIVDSRQTAVNLPRFVAALRLTEPSGAALAPLVPEQREPRDA